MEHIEIIAAVIAGILMFTAQFVYMIQIWRRTIQPNHLAWFGFALMLGSALVSQIIQEGWNWSHLGLVVSTIDCFLIFAIAQIKKQYNYKHFDWIYFGLGMLCAAVYILSKDAWITTIFSVAADLVLAIPMLIKAFRDPASERSPAWLLASFSWIITLGIGYNESLVNWVVPIYLLSFNTLMIYLGYFYKKSTIVKSKLEA